MTILFTLLGFALGMLPLSLWLAMWSSGDDLRRVGDKNPGATNAWRSAGWKIGLMAYLVDIGKAAIPVGLACQIFHVQGFQILPVALAPILGHVFSPLMGWRGGKGLATVLGAWIGISLLEIPLVILCGLLVFFFLLRGDAWVILGTEIWTMIYLLIWQPNLAWITFFICIIVLMSWTHRQGFQTPPTLRRKR